MAEMLLDVRELQRRLSCGRSVAYALLATGTLPTVRVGRALRVPESALDEFVRSGGVREIGRPTNGDAQTPKPITEKRRRGASG
jgi:excisionase family DNA binding protein